MAGVSAKDIKNRIRSLGSTRQITKAMEMVASSKLRRAQEQVNAARPYFETLRQTIHNIMAANRDFSSVYLKTGEEKKVLYVVIAGDRGLAGGYNGNILKLVQAQTQGREMTVLPVGKKALEYFQSHCVPVYTQGCSDGAAMSVGSCFTAAKALCRGFQEGEFDAVYLAYTEFVSVLSQTPKVMRLLPLERGAHTFQPGQVTLYEPDGETVFDTIVPEYLGGVLYGALCESRASEHAARRTAMDSATQNADEMIAELRLKFNRARQAAITQEITEIVAGAKRS